MHSLLTILLLLNLYLPCLFNQGTVVTAYVANPCGPINDTYLEFHFEPGGEVVRLGTDENGQLRFMGPKADYVEARLYGNVVFTEIVRGDKVNFNIKYDWCG